MKADSGCQETRDHSRRLLRGSLLHDIGKLVQRASERPTDKRHAEYGADWLEEVGGFSDILDLVRYHHSWDDIAKIPLLTILSAADALAAGERLGSEDEKKLKWEREMPLLSLFCKIALPGGGLSAGMPEAAKAYYYPVRDASKPNYPLPLEELRKAGLAGNRANYRSLLDGLQRDLDELLRATPGALGQGEGCDVPFVDDFAILFLLDKHLQYVPGHTYRPSDDPMTDPDISLYDHSRLTAAVALCLFDYFSHRFSGQKIEDWPVWDHVFKDSEKEADGSGFNESFFREDVFVYADINLSGIQDFLYNISTRKAARSLRARSFFLEMLCEDLAQEAIDRLSLSRCNVVFTGGGRARLLLPNIPKSIEVLEEVEKGANLYCRERLGGALSVNVSWVELKPAQFVIGAKRSSGVPSLGTMMMELSRKASRRKEDRLIEEIIGGEAPGILGPLPPLDEECRICHVETDKPKIVKEIDEEEGIIACPVCEALVDLGRRLRSAREVFLAAPPDGADAGGLPLPFSTLFTPRPEEGKVKLRLVVDGRWEARNYAPGRCLGFSYPRLERYETFEEMADEALGEDRIGVLRMDVDDLGAIFAQGIPEEERSFTRLSVLSRMLNSFFKEALPAVVMGAESGAGKGGTGGWRSLFLERVDYPADRRRAIEVIYSGGDDLFIVGAWSDVLEAAFDIRERFGAFTANNPCLHLSGGVVVYRHDYPLYRLAELSAQEEENAKSLEGKDAFSFCGVAAKWDDYREVWSRVFPALFEQVEGKRIALDGEIRNGKRKHYARLFVSRQFLRRVMIAFQPLTILETVDSERFKITIPRLHYYLGRQKELMKHRRPDEARVSQWQDLESELIRSALDLEPLIYPVFVWADLLCRGG